LLVLGFSVAVLGTSLVTAAVAFVDFGTGTVVFFVSIFVEVVEMATVVVISLTVTLTTGLSVAAADLHTFSMHLLAVAGQLLQNKQLITNVLLYLLKANRK